MQPRTKAEIYVLISVIRVDEVDDIHSIITNNFC